MSIRSALEELLLIVEIHQKHTKNNFAWAEVEYAKELLAQPEQELMTSRAIIQACPEHYCDMEKDAFRVGINWYEKYVARIGVYSNE